MTGPPGGVAHWVPTNLLGSGEGPGAGLFLDLARHSPATTPAT
ncbi:MAG TPA: hypothetical protein VII46_05785 [Acidimicrobiales bacterium]